MTAGKVGSRIPVPHFFLCEDKWRLCSCSNFYLKVHFTCVHMQFQSRSIAHCGCLVHFSYHERSLLSHST